MYRGMKLSTRDNRLRRVITGTNTPFPVPFLPCIPWFPTKTVPPPERGQPPR